MEVILNLLNKMKDIYCHVKLTVTLLDCATEAHGSDIEPVEQNERHLLSFQTDCKKSTAQHRRMKATVGWFTSMWKSMQPHQKYNITQYEELGFP